MRSFLAVFLGIVTALAATLLALPRSATVVAPATAPEAAPASAAPAVDPTLAGPPTPAQIARGARTYRTLCLACHLPDGKGMTGLVPPLAGADFMAADRTRTVQIVLKGLNAPITVNGVAYQGLMPGLENVLTDAQVADVLTYVFNSWGNTGEAFAPEHIAALREQWRALAPVVAPPANP
ncbi:MAG: hypothetical protein C0502_08500 [Opitutus sp.]|nr:hypothetical protein [Opitutus sp.]